MSRKFKTVDYEAALNASISVREALPSDHLARFVVELVGQLEMEDVYRRYGQRGGEAYAPEVLLALLFYSYATGVFSSRKIERATYEAFPFRFVAGGLHPDHDTLANFRQRFRVEIEESFVQVLLLAQTAGYLKPGNISLDGSKVQANASKSQAVSYKRLLELEVQMRAEVETLLRLADGADQQVLPEASMWSMRWRSVSSDWNAWRRQRRCWKLGPKSVTRRSAPNTKPSNASARRRSNGQVVSPLGDRRSRRQGRMTKTSTTSPIQNRGS